MTASISIHDVHKTFRNGSRAVQGISLDIPEGAVFGVLGPNGAGKTTLMNMISTLLLPDAGDIQVGGYSVRRDARAIRRLINLCSGHANFAWSLTLRENLRFYAMLYGLRGADRERQISELIHGFSLGAFADRRFDEVSTGTKQRLALAKALINRPRILLLDEPTVGLDPDVALRVRAHILEYHRQSRCTLVLTTHYMQEAEELCQDIAFIRDGKVLARGTPEALRRQVRAASMEQVFLELAK